ncbi:hypothetical protein [Streptosporangium vulgare]|uniref:hypothetical protein n=1 Tax=Streptosporangium vulgare TaxID=46190 RepID=UPI0031DE2816
MGSAAPGTGAGSELASTARPMPAATSAANAPAAMKIGRRERGPSSYGLHISWRGRSLGGFAGRPRGPAGWVAWGEGSGGRLFGEASNQCWPCAGGGASGRS